MLNVYYTKISDNECRPDAFWTARVSVATWQAVQEFKSRKARITRLLGESMLRCLLRSVYCLGEADYRIGKGPHGKPYLEGLSFPLYFNISHSGDYVVCALSDNEVGIDIEKRAVARMSVARRYFHVEEIRALEVLSGEQQRDLFYRLWVIKESFLKYTGTGLSASLHSFKVCSGERGMEIRKNGAPEKVRLCACSIDPEYTCFVCSAAEEQAAIYPFEWPEQS